jgi:hypothetical protein
MALLTPLFLLGFLGLALPWWLHRLETQATEREKFATTRFLEPSKKRIHVRRKLKYLLLMALRMAFLALLALTFARPILFDTPGILAGDDTIHHVIVVDTSFSMRAEGSMARARELAGDILDNMGNDDIASLYAASTDVATVMGPRANTSELRASLATLAADNGRLDLGAMVSMLDTMLKDTQGNIVLHVVSDFQQTGQALRFADMVPSVLESRPVTLQLHQVTTENRANHTVETVVVEDRSTVIAGIRSSNLPAGSAVNLQAALQVNDVQQQQQSVTVNGNGVTLLRFENVSFAEGDNRVDIRIEAQGDGFTADNVRHTVFDNAPPAPVLLLTDDAKSLGVTYIRAALETAPRGYRVEVQPIADFDPRVMQRYPWLIVEDLGIVNGGLEAAMADYVNGGGAVLAGLGPRSGALSRGPVLGNTMQSPAIDRSGRPLRPQITRIDTSHPVLADSSGWSSVNVSAFQLETRPEDRVLIAQGARTPVLIERLSGAGRFLLFASSLDNSAADLPVKPVFVTFMAEAARYLSNEKMLVKQQVADSYLQLARSGGSSGQVVDPSGNSLLSLQDTTRNQDVQLRETGYYQVFTPAGEVLVAVNPDIRESDLTLMPAQALQNWQTTVSTSGTRTVSDVPATTSAQPDAEEIDLWRIGLILLVLLALAESMLGNRYLNFKTGTAQ